MFVFCLVFLMIAYSTFYYGNKASISHRKDGYLILYYIVDYNLYCSMSEDSEVPVGSVNWNEVPYFNIIFY